MRTFVIAGAAAVALATSPALAEITVNQAMYEAGILVVHGQTTHPNREIRLDGRYAETADEAGAFRFRVRYLPDDCTVSLFDGEDRRTAFIRGCKTSDAVDIAPKSEERQDKGAN